MWIWSVQLRKGLVELCVMAALRDGEAYGYQIVQRLGRIDCLGGTESTIYPILARLARDSLLCVRAGPSPTGPPRRYYRLTPLGFARLREMETTWRVVQAAVNSQLKGQSQ